MLEFRSAKVTPVIGLMLFSAMYHNTIVVCPTFLGLLFKCAAPLLVACRWSLPNAVALTKWPVKGLPAAPITLKGFVSSSPLYHHQYHFKIEQEARRTEESTYLQTLSEKEGGGWLGKNP